MPEVRVLVVDDQETFRGAMSAVVDETVGFVVVGEAASGEEALELAGVLHPDLVLMDVHLPGIDGVEAARRLTASGGTVILLSTYDEEAIDVAGSGAIGYIIKSSFGPQRLDEVWTRARPAP